MIKLEDYTDEYGKGPINYKNLVRKRARMEGFFVFDYRERFDEAEAKLSERVDKTCCVCQEDFEEGMPLRSLVRCRHVYHVECIDRWAYSEMGKGRLPKCPLCNTHL